MEHSSTPGLIVGPFICSRKSVFCQKQHPESEERRRRRRGEGGSVLGIVSLEDTNGFWCHVFFTQHLTHGAIPLQSLHFNAHYDEVCHSNRLTFGHFDCPK